MNGEVKDIVYNVFPDLKEPKDLILRNCTAAPFIFETDLMDCPVEFKGKMMIPVSGIYISQRQLDLLLPDPWFKEQVQHGRLVILDKFHKPVKY